MTLTLTLTLFCLRSPSEESAHGYFSRTSRGDSWWNFVSVASLPTDAGRAAAPWHGAQPGGANNTREGAHGDGPSWGEAFDWTCFNGSCGEAMVPRTFGRLTTEMIAQLWRRSDSDHVVLLVRACGTAQSLGHDTHAVVTGLTGQRAPALVGRDPGHRSVLEQGRGQK